MMRVILMVLILALGMIPLELALLLSTSALAEVELFWLLVDNPPAEDDAE